MQPRPQHLPAGRLLPPAHQRGDPVTLELKERLRGKTVVASVSGGKDSTAMALWLIEQGISIAPVFLDTQWEDPETYEYIRGPLSGAIGAVHEVKGRGMVEFVRHKGTFPSRQRRWCTEELKLKPMRAFCQLMMAGGAEPVVAVGVRDEESAARAAQSEWEWSDFYDCEVWRPIKKWTLQEVVDIHARHGLAPNPRYLQGAKRVGCKLCICSSKDAVREVADHKPDTISEIEALERELSDRAGAQRGWFQSPLGRTGVWPIRDVVEWSRTTRGGKQYDLLPRDEREGCMRWGLCDTGDER